MTDALTITNLVYDEAGLPDVDADLVADNNVASLSAALTTQIGALNPSLSGHYYTGANAVTQYAELTNFVSSTDNPVTNYSLASNSSGAGFSTSGAGVATGLYVGSNEIFLYGTSDPNVVVGRIGSGTTGSSSGSIAMVLALNETKDGSGHVTGTDLGIAMYAPLVNSDGSHVDDLDTLSPLNGSIYLYSTFNTTTIVDFPNFIGVPSGDDEYALVKPGNNTAGANLLLTGFAGGVEGSVNVSTTGLGANAQTVATGSSLRIDLVSLTAADYNFQLGMPQGAHDITTLHYENHVEVASAGFQLTQNNPNGKVASLTVSAYQVSVDSKGSAFATNAFTDGALVKINVNQVVIHDANNVDVTSSFTANISQSVDGKSVQITNLPALYHVDFTTSSEFDRFVVFNNQTGTADKTTFDIGKIHVSTITGGSGSDSADLSPHLIFEDGGPSVSLTSVTAPTVTVDETTLGVAGAKSADFSTLFQVNYGPDGPAATALDYALSIGGGAGANSTLVDTATGHGIFLYKDGNDIVGRVGATLTTASSSGAIDFRISVDSSGHVTFEQDHAVKHSDPEAADESAAMTTASLVQLTATAHDGDGDSATSGAANIATAFRILDDEPIPLGSGANLIVGNATTDLASPAYAHTASSSFTLGPGNDGMGGFTIAGPADTAGDYTWAYTDSSHTSIIESYKGGQLFSVSLDSSTGGYAVTMLGTLPFSQLNLDANNIKAGGPTGSIDVGTINDDGDYVQISGTTNSGAAVGAVNASNGNVGVANGNLDGGEALSFSLFSSTNAPIAFYGLNMGTKTAQGATYHLYGVLDSDHTTVADLGVQSLSKGGVITYSGSVLLDSIIVQETAGNAVKIGLAGVHLLLPPADTGFHFTAQLTDGDGDHVSSSFNVFIDGNNDGVVDTLHGFFPA